MAHSRKARSHRKPGPSAAFIVGLTFGAVAVLAVLGLVLSRSFGLPGPTAIPALGGGGLFDVPNPNVTEENYERLEDGATPEQVEAILGPGRIPIKADFDAIFGEWIPELARLPHNRSRKVWEENNLAGDVRIWDNAPKYIMVNFFELPNRGRRLVAKLYRQDNGSFKQMQGTGQPQVAPKAEPRPEGRKKSAPPGPNGPMPSVTVEQLLDDYAMDRDAADAKYRNRKVKVSGTIDSVLVTVVTFRSTGARLQARLNGVAYGLIGKKKRGDSLAVVGSVQAFFPANARASMLVMLENCSIEE